MIASFVTPYLITSCLIAYWIGNYISFDCIFVIPLAIVNQIELFWTTYLITNKQERIQTYVLHLQKLDVKLT